MYKTRSLLAFVAALVVALPSAAETVVTQIQLPGDIGGLVYSPLTNLFYVSVRDSAATYSNSLLPIDPDTGAFGTPISIGFNPGEIVISSDGAQIYSVVDVGTKGNRAAIQNYDLQTQSLAPRWDMPIYSSVQRMAVGDLAAIPGRPNAVLASLTSGVPSNSPFTGSPIHTSVWQDGIELPQIVGNQNTTTDAPRIIAVNESGDRAYGYFRDTKTSFSMTISANGVTNNGEPTLTGVLNDVDIEVLETAEGKLFTNLGAIYDLLNPAYLGFFSQGGGSRGAFTIDVANNKLFAQVGPGIFIYQLDAMSLTPQFVPVMSTFDADYLIRFGADGLAYRASPSTLVVLRSNLVPEPSTYALAAIGFAAVFVARRRKRLLSCGMPAHQASRAARRSTALAAASFYLVA